MILLIPIFTYALLTIGLLLISNRPLKDSENKKKGVKIGDKAELLIEQLSSDKMTVKACYGCVLRGATTFQEAFLSLKNNIDKFVREKRS